MKLPGRHVLEICARVQRGIDSLLFRELIAD